MRQVGHLRPARCGEPVAVGCHRAASCLIGLLERRNPVLLRMGCDSLAVLLLFAAGVGLLSTLR